MSSRAKVASKSPAKVEPKKQAPPAKVQKKDKVPAPTVIKGPFAASNFAKNGLSQEEVTQIKNAFDLFDTDQGGSIDTKQLKAAMVSLGFQSKNGAIFRMIADLDSDGNGTIDFPQFLGLMTNKITGQDSRAQLGKVFAMFDDEKSGYLSTANLARVAQSLGQTVSQQELEEMLKRADTDHDGFVNEEQFYNIITRKM